MEAARAWRGPTWWSAASGPPPKVPGPLSLRWGALTQDIGHRPAPVEGEALSERRRRDELPPCPGHEPVDARRLMCRGGLGTLGAVIRE